MSTPKKHGIISVNCPIQPQGDNDTQKRNVEIPNDLYTQMSDFTTDYNRAKSLVRRNEKIFFADTVLILSDVALRAMAGEVILPVNAAELDETGRALKAQAETALKKLHGYIENQ